MGEKVPEYVPSALTHHDCSFPCFVYEDDVDFIENELDLDQKDIITAAYPRAGVTWIQHIVSIIKNNGDVDAADNPMSKRFPHIEISDPQTMADLIEDNDPPRTIKTNLPLEILKRVVFENKARVIYLGRNPKDNLVSYYHFHRMNALLNRYEGSWDQFYEVFWEKRLVYGDVFAHQLEWWKAAQDKNNDNILFLKYEDMIKDLAGGIRKIAKFMDKDLSEELIKEISEATTFEEMSTNPNTNYSKFDGRSFKFSISPFMRSGKVGQWKEYFNEEQNEYVDTIYEQTMKKVGLVYDFE